MDESKKAELIAKHGKGNLVAFTSKSGVDLVFRKPSRLEFDFWFDRQTSVPKAQAGRELAITTMAYPDDKTQLEAFLEEHPAKMICSGGILDSILGLAGWGDDDVAAKKL